MRKGLLDVVQAVVGADDCLGVGVGQVGDSGWLSRQELITWGTSEVREPST